VTCHGADRDEIVDDIVMHLRPLKITEKSADALTRSYIEALNRTTRFTSDIAPGAALRAHRRFRNSLKSTIEDYERLPPGTKVDLMHFAPPRQWPPQQYDPALVGDPVLTYLTQLAAVIGSPVFTKADGAAVKFTLTRAKATRRAAAGWAYKLMRNASRTSPAGTEDGSYRTIASRLYEAVSGVRTGMKSWCNEEIRRQRARKAILRDLGIQE
jgi:hypothetical protein